MLLTKDSRMLYKYLESRLTVAASIAPTFQVAWPGISPGQMAAALSKIGFTYAEETALAIPFLTNERERLFQAGGKAQLSTSCPVLIELVKLKFPHLEKYIPDLFSPMVMHCKMLKEKFGFGIKTVFIGPCYAKKLERRKRSPASSYVDLVLTFSELDSIFEQQGIVPNNLPEERLGDYPPAWARVCYQVYTASGLKEVQAHLQAISDLEPNFYELLNCHGGCACGTGMPRKR